MFDIQNWIILTHAHLRGFPGFVFGILILAAIPMYIATTTIIVRTKKPLFTIPLPKFMEPVPIEAPKEQTEKESTGEAPKEDTPVAEEKILPAELRAMYVRARAHIGPNPKSNFDISNLATQIVSSTPELKSDLQPSGELPLPNDFDIEPDASDEDFMNFTPTFSDINFDEEPESVATDAPTDSSASQAPTKTTNVTSEELAPVTNYLTEHGKEYFIENDVIIMNGRAISVHTDNDFWVADEEIWFASGKQKTSPIMSVLEAAKKHDAEPVLYLGSVNILDLDSNRDKWSSQGIKVITELSDL